MARAARRSGPAPPTATRRARTPARRGGSHGDDVGARAAHAHRARRPWDRDVRGHAGHRRPGRDATHVASLKNQISCSFPMQFRYNEMTDISKLGGLQGKATLLDGFGAARSGWCHGRCDERRSTDAADERAEQIAMIRDSAASVAPPAAICAASARCVSRRRPLTRLGSTGPSGRACANSAGQACWWLRSRAVPVSACASSVPWWRNSGRAWWPEPLIGAAFAGAAADG